MTTCLCACDMNAIGDADAIHGKFASVNNQYLYLHFSTQSM